MMHKLNIARELIAYQTDGFKDRLVALVAKLFECRNQRDAQASPYLDQLEALLFDRFGLKLKCILDTPYPPCSMPIIANPNQAINTVTLFGAYADEERSFLKALRALPEPKGTIDLKNAKVTGVFSKMEITLHLPVDELREFTPPQAAGIILHEVGHCFTTFEFMFRTYKASQLLAALHQAKTGRTSGMSYEYVIDAVAERMYKEGLLESPKALEELVVVKGDVAMATMVMSRVWCKLANDFGSDTAAGPNEEALADNFALRFGLGAEMAQVVSTFGGTVNKGLQASLFYVLGSLMTPAFGALFGIATVGAAFPVAAVGAALACTLAVFTGGYTDDDGEQMSTQYDDTVRRVERIKRGMIEVIKSESLTQAQKAVIATQVDVITKMMKNKQASSTLWTDIANFAFSKRREAKLAIKLEDDIESLAFNDLFVRASSLAGAV